MSRPLLPPKNPELTVTPNSFVDPEIGAQATQDALLKNLYSARLYGWKVRAPLKGPDDPALYEIVKKWNVANGKRASGVLNLITLRAMTPRLPQTLAKITPVPVEIDLSAASGYGILTDKQLNPDDRRFLRFFEEQANEEAAFDSKVLSLRAEREQNEIKQRKQHLMLGAAALGVVGLLFFLRRKK